ncbi:MAG: tyrosine-type recombinase/integrase [Patescibacteria group bacterium]|nr:tyrosine-type recombinase/integrase [Patescibacteria group bacterium]
MASVFKAKGAKRYTILYHDENGKRRKKTGATDKAVSQRIANELENRVALRREGLIDPAAERFAECERQPIGEHLDDFIATMEARNCDPKHVRTTRTYVQRIIDQAGAARLSDLTLSAVELAVGRIQKLHGLSARAVNAHTTAAKAFVNWAKEDNRIRAHELESIDRQSEDADRRYVRRPMSAAELRTLIASARTAPEWRGISGEDRSMFYLLGAMTGFRRTEMGSLQPEDFDLAGPMPIVRLDASRTKNDRDAGQPIPATVADVLKVWLAAKAPGSPVFALPEKTALMLHADLRRCGIEPVDDQGRVVDTHSLRHGYISALALAGVPVKVAQTLARHSDPKLTMNVYAHLSAFDLHGAVAGALPDLTTVPEPNVVAATGTHGPGATSDATSEDADGRNLNEGKHVASNRMLTLNQRVVGSSPTGGIHAGKRTDAQGSAAKPSLAVISTPSAPMHSVQQSRTDAHQSGYKRPSCATESATGLLPEMLPADPALMEVVNAWDRLPEAVRAGIVAMVKAATGSNR